MADPVGAGAGLAPGLLVWRIENFELAPVDAAYHGQLYSGDSYVLLHTSGAGASALRNDIFIWQGEHSSQDERGASAIQAVQLAERISAAGGAHCSQSREAQGNESEAFKALFKRGGGGLVYLQGGVKSGFHHVEEGEHEPCLLHVKGRHSVVTRQVPVAVRSLTAGDCYILDLHATLYLFTGPQANTVEKVKALEMMERLNSSRGGRCERIVLATAEPARVALFWHALGGSEADVQPATSDDDGESEAAAGANQPPKLFALSAGKAPALIAEGHLTRAALLAAAAAPGASHTFLVDAGAECFVWVAHAAPALERHRSLELADAYIAAQRPAAQEAPLPPGWTAVTDEEGDVYYENDDDRVPSQWERPVDAAAAKAAAPPRVTIVHEGGETPQFEGLFAMWSQPPTFDFSHKHSAGVVHASQGAAATPVDFDALAAAAAAAIEATETVSLKTFAIVDTSVTPIADADAGEFYAGDCVVVEHTARAVGSKGPGATTVYFWLGKKASHIETGHAALTAIEVEDRAKQAGRLAHSVRVVQGSEPPAFAAAFGGLLIVHQGERGSAASAAASPRLYHVKGVSPRNVRAVQVDARASALNSGDCFVLCSGGGSGLWCWAGAGSSAEERAAASRLAARLARGAATTNITEGAEPAAFWSLLGGKAPYATRVPALPIGRAPRLFEARSAGGIQRVEEVLSFGQGDLLPDSVCVLDAASSIFVWVGSAASDGMRRAALDIATKYVAAGARAGRLDADVPVARVEAGCEPPEFTALFAGWDDSAANAGAGGGPDLYEVRLAQLAAQRAAEGDRLAAGQASREARNQAALALIEAKRAAASAVGAGGAPPVAWTKPLKKAAAGKA
jgi:villin 1/advillin